MARAVPSEDPSGGEARRWARAFDRPRPRAFYARPTLAVARDLLGSFVVHRTMSEFRVVRLVEVEAYIHGDPASHAFRGPTQRNRSMFLGPGTLYVFRIHQVHCANAVTQSGEAVLLRAAEPIAPKEGNPSGPGRLSRVLELGREHDGLDLTHSEVRIIPGPARGARILVGPRVGISKAIDWPLRFSLAGNRWVSSPRPRAVPPEGT